LGDKITGESLMSRLSRNFAPSLCGTLASIAAALSLAESQSDTWARRFAESTDGKQIAYYTVSGTADTVPLIVISGGPGSDHRYMRAAGTFQELAANRRVVMYDQRATGDSAPAPENPTVELWLDDIEAIRHALGARQIDLMGHSWGGYLAMSYATEYPDRVRGLVLVDSAAPTLSNNVQLLSSIYPERSVKWQEVRQNLSDEFTAKEISIFFSMEFLDSRWYQRFLSHVEGFVYNISVNNDLRDDMNRRDLASRLPDIRQPTLVLHGRFDAVLAVETSWNIHNVLPNSTFHVFERSGHMPFIEERGPFIRNVTDFLSELDGTAAQ
jgi:proline iminopeptidase